MIIRFRNFLDTFFLFLTRRIIQMYSINIIKSEFIFKLPHENHIFESHKYSLHENISRYTGINIKIYIYILFSHYQKLIQFFFYSTLGIFLFTTTTEEK